MARLDKVTAGTLNHRPGIEFDPHARLGAAILLSAFKDMDSPSDTVRRKARYFFTSGAFKVWADVAHRDYDTVMRGYRNVLANGYPDHDARRVRYRRSGG